MTPPNQQTTAVLGRGVRIEGELRLDHAVAFDGELAGMLRVAGSVLLQSEAVVRGDVVAQSCTLQGRIEGDLTDSGLARLEGGGTVAGQITAAALEITAGAAFDGPVRIMGEKGAQGSSDPGAQCFASARADDAPASVANDAPSPRPIHRRQRGPRAVF